MRKWLLKLRLTPAKIVAIYGFVGVLWILCSDKFLELFFNQPNIEKLTKWQTLKGWLYVLVTALLLYHLISRYAAALQKSKKELQLHEAKLEAIIETNADGIVVFDRTGCIAIANAAAERHLGLSREEAIGRRYNDSIWQLCRIQEEGFIETELPFLQVMQTGEPLKEIEYAIVRPDGTQFFLSIGAVPLYDRQGQIDSIVVSIADITHHKEAEALARDRDIAEARNRAKSEFLAQMSHEIRTPLNSILGLSQMLQREIFGELNSKQKEYVNRIKSSGDHLLELINDILDLSKVEAGKAELRLSEVKVPELCRYCLKLVQERAYEQGLQLKTAIDPEATICIADERRLKQMLLNLLSNAIKFTPAGEVSLIVKKQESAISFTVADTGIGISEEHLPLVFHPFHQLNNELNQKMKGTGLGLALTRDFAQLHGGDISAISTLGKGSQFTIHLPDTPPGYLLTDIPEAHSNPTSYQEISHQKARISIVDYEASNAILLRDYLQAMGYEVQAIAYSADFLCTVQSFDPQLILLDVQLANPLMGLGAIGELRQQPNLQDLPLVVVTAMAMSGDRERCLNAGATDYLSKPIQLEELDAMLVRYISGNC